MKFFIGVVKRLSYTRADGDVSAPQKHCLRHLFTLTKFNLLCSFLQFIHENLHSVVILLKTDDSLSFKITFITAEFSFLPLFTNEENILARMNWNNLGIIDLAKLPGSGGKPHTVCLWCHQVGLAGIAVSENRVEGASNCVTMTGDVQKMND